MTADLVSILCCRCPVENKPIPETGHKHTSVETDSLGCPWFPVTQHSVAQRLRDKGQRPEARRSWRLCALTTWTDSPQKASKVQTYFGSVSGRRLVEEPSAVPALELAS